MSGTSVPPIQFTPTGPVAPQESAIVAGVAADMNAAFGGNLNTSPATPQGQLITSTAAFLGNNYNQQAALFQGMDPAYAAGRQQDGIARIYFLERNPAQSTVLQIACGGLTGVVIPVGASVSDQSGIRYLCTGQGTIPSGGSITLSFASVPTGPIPVPASVAIYQSIPGWNTVAVSGGAVGNLVQSRAAFELQRQATIAANGAGFLPAIAGAVGKVAGVIDYYVTENPTGSPVTVGDVTLAANSLYICVAGGASSAIAQAIWTKKNPGCNYNGNTTVTVYDTNPGYSAPYPSYTVTFQTPQSVANYFAVTMANSAQVPANAASLISSAINNAFLGEDGGTRARIGSTVYASRYYAGIAALGTWAQIISIQVACSETSPSAGFTASVSGTALAITGSITGTIAAGQFLIGNGVAPGTTIVSGSGMSWVLSIGQTIGSQSFTTITANKNDVAMDIDWLPTYNPANTLVTLV